MNRVRCLILNLLLTTQVAYAGVSADAGGWKIRGEYLYLLPSVSQSYFAQDVNLSSGGTPIGRRYKNDFHGHGAYRLEGLYAFCNCLSDFQLTGTYVPRATTKASADSAAARIGAVQGIPTNVGLTNYNHADSRIQFEYGSLDALFGFWGLHCQCLDLFFRAGLHGARFSFDEKINYFRQQAVTPNVTRLIIFKNRSKNWGLGPELAFQMQYSPLWCQQLLCHQGNLSLAASIKGALLAHRHKPEFTQTIVSCTNLTCESAVVPVKDDKRWEIIPYCDMRLGLNFSKRFGCRELSFEFGYEMFLYQNAISRISFLNAAGAPSSIDLYSDVGFHGPYVSASLSF